MSASKTTEGPFTQALAQARSATEEFSKLFTSLKLPPVPDSEALLAAHRRNVEALSTANRIALEGAQAVAKRHMEIMQQTMSELTDQMRALSTAEPAAAKAARQADLLKQSYERAVANTKELTDLIQRANSEAVGALSHRFSEALDEVKQLAGKAEATH